MFEHLIWRKHASGSRVKAKVCTHIFVPSERPLYPFISVRLAYSDAIARNRIKKIWSQFKSPTSSRAFRAGMFVLVVTHARNFCRICAITCNIGFYSGIWYPSWYSVLILVNRWNRFVEILKRASDDILVFLCLFSECLCYSMHQLFAFNLNF